jgi:hypothetical protein
MAGHEVPDGDIGPFTTDQLCPAIHIIARGRLRPRRKQYDDAQASQGALRALRRGAPPVRSYLPRRMHDGEPVLAALCVALDASLFAAIFSPDARRAPVPAAQSCAK